MTDARQVERYNQFRTFAAQLKKLARTADFKMSARGYCYLLEDHGLLKDEFDRADGIINRCRKGDHLIQPLPPVDFTADDDARTPSGLDGTQCVTGHSAPLFHAT